MATMRLSPALAVLVLASPLACQISWQQQGGMPAPLARENHCAAYDMTRSRLVVYGGDNGGPAFSDTWEFDGTAWQLRTPTASPGPRWAASMAFDPVTGTTILFGGTTVTGGSSPNATTWRWNGTTWTQLQPPQSPPALLGHAMATDLLNNRIVLFGGRDPSSAHLAQTWIFDGTTWTQLTSSPQPPARCCHDLALDFTTGSLVLFGGWGGSNFGDTWELVGNSWFQRSPAQSPTARWGHRMAWSAAFGGVVLHGKSTPSAGNDTWAWNGTTWQLLPLAAPYPTVWNAVLKAEFSVGRLFMFGGSDGTATNKLFTLDSTAPGSFTATGFGCAGPSGTPALTGLGFPWIGTTVSLSAAPIPILGVFVLGMSNTISGGVPLPLPLAFLGMPGCSLQVSLDTLVTSSPGGGAAQVAVQIPLLPSLVGTTFHVQAGSFDPGANPFGLTISNAVAVSIGGV
ncbi:MAG TPA: kelch repeat-containing protein [Planctomycetota bacterium]